MYNRLQQQYLDSVDGAAHQSAIEILGTVGDLLDSVRFEAIGWTYAFCCAALDDGNDPRTVDCAEMIANAKEQLTPNTKLTGTKCPVER